MTANINSNTASNTNVPAIKSVPAAQKPFAARVGGTAKRLLNALMRSLATPHV